MTEEQTQALLEEAQIFWKEVDQMGYIIERSDINNSKPNRRFNQIQQLILAANIMPVKGSDFKTQTPEETFKMVRDLHSEIFSGKYDEDIKMFESKTKESTMFVEFDGGIAFEVNPQNKTKTVSKIRLYSLKSLYSATVLSHEDMHGLFCLKPIEESFNYNYNELLPIMMEKIMAHKLGSDILLKKQAIRMQHFKSATEEYRSIIPYFSELDIPNENLSPTALALKYSFYNSYGYMISSIYAEQLFSYYLESPKEIATRIENIIERKENIPTVLKDLNINLGDNNTFNTFQKTLGRVSK